MVRFLPRTPIANICVAFAAFVVAETGISTALAAALEKQTTDEEKHQKRRIRGVKYRGKSSKNDTISSNSSGRRRGLPTKGPTMRDPPVTAAPPCATLCEGGVAPHHGVAARLRSHQHQQKGHLISDLQRWRPDGVEGKFSKKGVQRSKMRGTDAAAAKKDKEEAAAKKKAEEEAAAKKAEAEAAAKRKTEEEAAAKKAKEEAAAKKKAEEEAAAKKAEAEAATKRNYISRGEASFEEEKEEKTRRKFNQDLTEIPSGSLQEEIPVACPMAVPVDCPVAGEVFFPSEAAEANESSRRRKNLLVRILRKGGKVLGVVPRSEEYKQRRAAKNERRLLRLQALTKAAEESERILHLEQSREVEQELATPTEVTNTTEESPTRTAKTEHAETEHAETEHAETEHAETEHAETELEDELATPTTEEESEN